MRSSWKPDGSYRTPPRTSPHRPRRSVGTPGNSASAQVSLERATCCFGIVFLLCNVALVAFWLPHPDIHIHGHSVREAMALPHMHSPMDLLMHKRRLRRSPPPPHAPGATDSFAVWLHQCAAAPRCSCLVHGTSEAVEGYPKRYPNATFFFAVPAHAEALARRLANASNAYVLEVDLARLGAAPLRNDVVNAKLGVLSALQALQLSNEFFDLQVVHAAAVPALRRPSAGAARSVLALAAVTLLLPAVPTPPGEEPSGPGWRELLPALGTPVAREADGVAAAAELQAALEAEGCGAGGAGGAGCGAWGEATSDALLVTLAAMRRVNVHHLSCWDAPRCHQRMYVMDLPRLAHDADLPGAPERGEWVRRVPRLFRVDEAPRAGEGAGKGAGLQPGVHAYQSLADAWARRGKLLPYDTGGANLDSLVALGLLGAHRARLAADFLALPVGRDMMLWNIVAGAHGAFAIDQEGVVYPDGAVPWERRAMPYCLSVRDCYEKPLGALCGLPLNNPGQLYGQALTSAMATLMAERCPDATRPFACANGCQASYADCVRSSTTGAL